LEENWKKIKKYISIRKVYQNASKLPKTDWERSKYIK
jgi:hypothetical protein